MTNKGEKKILFFMNSLRMGGGERVSVDLMNTLAEDGHGVFLAVMEYEGLYKEQLSPKVIVKDLKTKKISIAFLKFLKYVIEVKPTTLFASSIHFNVLVLLARFLTLRFRTKVIIRIGSPFSLLFKEFKSFKDKKILLWMTKILYPFANTVICVAECVKNDLLSFVCMSEKKCKVMYSPKNVEDVIKKSNEPISDGLEMNKSPLFVFVGRLTRAKDPVTALRAFILFKKEGREGTFIFIGDGEKRQELESVIRENKLENSVLLLGPQQNPYPFMKKAISIVSSSTSEGLPNVLLEALILQKPIIATDCFPGGAREIVKPTDNFEGIEESSLGMLVPIQNPELLAKAFVRIVEANKYQPAFPDRLAGSKNDIWSIF